MTTQLIANTLQVFIAAGLLYQFVTLTRCAARAARRRAVHTQPRRVVVEAAPVCRTRVRRRDYRVALRMARASVAA